MLLKQIRVDGSMDQRRLMPAMFMNKVREEKIKGARKRAEMSLSKTIKGKVFS